MTTFKNYINELPEDSNPDLQEDFLVEYDSDVNLIKITKLSNLDKTKLLGIKSYNGGNAVSTASATLVDMDASNCVVTFTAPDSGNVMVRIGLSTITNGGGEAYVGVREGTSIIAGPCFIAYNNGNYAQYNEISFYITGISPGSHTYKIAIATSSGTLYARCSSVYPATIQIWEV